MADDQAAEGLRWPVGRRQELASTKVLSDDEIAQFNRAGYVALREGFARDDALRLENEWWAELQDLYGIERDDPATWRQPGPDLRGAKISPSQSRIASARLMGAIDDLLGEGTWQLPGDWGRVLTTFPNCKSGDWDVPTELWHWDTPRTNNMDRISGLFIVMCIGPVKPKGGGTVIVSGSYRLLLKHYASLSAGERVEKMAVQRRALLGWHPWLAGLSGLNPGPRDRKAAFVDTATDVHGIPLQVVELTGEPGDVFLCHPLTMHAASPNAGDRPRFMRIKQHLMTNAARAKAPGKLRRPDPQGLRVG